MLSSTRRILRSLSRAPGFTGIAVATLALGIGANTAIFSVVNGVLLKSLPFEQSGDLLFLARPGTSEADVSLPDGPDIRDQSTFLHKVGLFNPFTAYDILGPGGEPERAAAAAVEPEYFEVLCMAPLVGRVISESDDVAGGERVAVLSEGFWRTKLGGDADVVGRTIELTGEPYTVIGVMPAEFDFLQAGVDLWVPIAIATPWAVGERGTNNLEAIARLAPGASIEAASSELQSITTRLAEQYPDTNQGKILGAVSLRDRIVGNASATLWMIFAAVGVVLLIACVNVANLFLVRATGREREMAVRMALGGGKLRIAAAQLGEATVLALAGGALGALIASWGTRALVAAAPATLPRADEITLDPAVLGFTLALSAVTALLFGWVPARHALKRDPADLLARAGGRGAAGGSHRFLGGFVVAEVALASLLLVGSGLLVRSFLSLQDVELGFDPERVVTANFVLPEDRYGDRDVQNAAFERLIRTLNEAAGVERGAFVLGAPMVGYGAIGSSLSFDDRPPFEPGNRPSARLRLVLGEYFETMDVPILRGRRFTEADDESAAKVAIVNQSFAAQYWPDQDPVGKRVATLMTGEPSWMTVVGVAGDVEQNNVAGGDAVTIYLPYPQRDMPWARFGTLVARGPGDFPALRGAIQSALWAVDPLVPFDGIAPLEDLVDASIAPQRFAAAMVALFAVLALVIAVQGLYGVLSYTVARCQGEIGVRIALGAASRDVLELVLRRGIALAAAGLLTGMLAALAATRLIRGLLFGVGTTDPATYVTVTLVLLATALAACAIPALRAARLDPAHTLREE